MLIEFSVENHRAIREKQTFSMVASDHVERARPHRAVETGFENAPRVLTSACIFGPNGAGKTSLTGAMSFMGRFVKLFHPSGQHVNIKVNPFAFHTDWKERPSIFQVAFIQNDTMYEYGFSLTASHVEAEWLSATDRNADNQRTIFTRTYNKDNGNYDWDLNSLIPKENQEQWISIVRPDALFLSAAVNFNFKNELEVVYNWMAYKFLPANDFIYSTFNIDSERINREGWKERVIKFLRHLGISIDDIAVVEKESGNRSNAGNDIPRPFPNVYFVRQNNVMSPVALDMFSESYGTRELFRLAYPVLEALDNGSTLVADEVNLGLHPVAFERLVSMFYNPEVNRHGAQLIFTTHDTGAVDHARIDSDQIWLMRKNDELAAVLYPLSDYDTSGQATFGGSYLDGRYGAIPRVLRVEP